jgi:hypothetical protein
MSTFSPREEDQTVTIGRLLDLAVALHGESGSLDLVSEYTRGQVELILDAAALPVAARESVLEALQERQERWREQQLARQLLGSKR